MTENTMNDKPSQEKFIALNELFTEYGIHPETEEEKISLMQ